MCTEARPVRGKVAASVDLVRKGSVANVAAAMIVVMVRAVRGVMINAASGATLPS